jgi:hypothetical protein
MSVPSEPQIYIRPGVWDSNIQLYWQPPLDNGGGNILSYTLECSNISLTRILPSTDTSAIASNLINGVDHTFTIYATNEFGNSNIATFRTVEPGTDPDNPTNIRYDADIGGNLLLSWNNPVFTGNANLIFTLTTFYPIDFRGNMMTESNIRFVETDLPEFLSRRVYFQNLNYSYRAMIHSINDSEYSDYNIFSDSFNPHIPSNGLKLWLDPYDRTTINLSNTNVIRWNDKSKNRSNANVSLSFAPTYDSANALINFNGSQYLNLPANTLPSSNLPYSMFMYVSTSNINLNNQWFLYSGTPSGNSSLAGYFNSSNIFHSWGNYQSLSNNTSTANTQVLLEYLYNGSNLYTYLDGSLILTQFSNVKNSTSANNIIGSNSTINGNLRGSIGEIVIYDRYLSDLERLSVENYLINKKRMLSLYNLGNLELWLDASDTNTLYDRQTRFKEFGNSNVYTWINESDSGIEVIPANASILPFNRPSQQNFLTTLEFNKSFLVSNSARYPTDAYIIVQLANLANVYDIIGIGNANIYNSLSYGLITPNSFMNASNDSTRNFISTSNETSNGYVMLEWTIANSNTYIRRFGDELVYDNRLNWTAPNNLNYYIGEGNTIDIANALVGNIGEIIIFNKQLIYNERRQIEGYLAHKWGLSSSLSNIHPYKNIPPSYFIPFMSEAPFRFSPNIYPNLLYWVDATDPSSYTLSGSTITNIRDKSSSNLTTTISGSPIVRVQNSFNTFGFNISATNFDSFNATLSNVIGTDNYAFAAVWQQTSNANASVITVQPSTLSYSSSAFLNIREGNAQSSTFNTPINNFFVHIGMRYGNTLVNYVNSNSTISASNINISNLGGNIIIGKSGTSIQPVIGDIAEAMIFKDLTQEQRITLEGYLARKYSIRLPPNHPYFLQQTLFFGTVFGTVNENGSITLTAPNNGTFTAVLFASYGTPGGSNGNYTIGLCHATNSSSIVASYFIGKNTATIPANNSIFGDPCNGTGKSLSILLQYSTENNYSSGFIVRVYNGGYFSDNVNWFTSQTVNYTATNITNMTDIGTATNGNRPVNANENYSVQWTGYFLCKVSGNHTFYTNSDDASFLWIGSTAITGFTTSNPLVNNGGLHGMVTQSGTINLTAGVYYPIRMQFGELSGGDDMQVSFQEPSGSRTYNFNTYAFNQGVSNFS